MEKRGVKLESVICNVTVFLRLSWFEKGEKLYFNLTAVKSITKCNKQCENFVGISTGIGICILRIFKYVILEGEKIAIF